MISPLLVLPEPLIPDVSRLRLWSPIIPAPTCPEQGDRFFHAYQRPVPLSGALECLSSNPESS